MTDYKEEQNNEIEALQSIYHDTFEGDQSGNITLRLGLQFDRVTMLEKNSQFKLTTLNGIYVLLWGSGK